jgi:transposase
MSMLDDMARLGRWKGYEVTRVEEVQELRREVWIELCPRAERALVCGSCGGAAQREHERERRHVRDLPIFDAQTHLWVWRARVWCEHCGGPKLEELSWLGRYRRVTVRLAEAVVRLCTVLPVKQVAGFYGLHWHTVKELDKEALGRRLEPMDLSDVELIGMDEFALHKGHRYATVVLEPTRKRVLWVGRGRGREDVRPFFELLGEGGCRRLRAVVMDMNRAYELEVRAHCPNAEVVYDLFHVVAKYGREVIDRVRVDEANRLRGDPHARRVVKSAKWLLLRNRENLRTPQEAVRLEELLAANQALMSVYVLRDDLKELWAHRDEQAAQTFWEQWHQRALASGLTPLVRFAQRLRPYLQGILAHCRWPLNTSLLEGVNNKIKVIKRMAYGFRDDAYFFLKIRAAFPGIPR